MSDVIEAAASFARWVHRNQKRQFTGLSYFEDHLQQVAWYLATVGLPDEVVAAGYLHDTVEDLDEVTIEMLRLLFGPNIATLVDEVTNVTKPSDGKRAWRSAREREHLSQASYHGKCIKLADMASNLKDVVKASPSYAKVYVPEKRLLLPILEDGHEQLVYIATRMLELAERELRELP